MNNMWVSICISSTVAVPMFILLYKVFPLKSTTRNFYLLWILSLPVSIFLLSLGFIGARQMGPSALPFFLVNYIILFPYSLLFHKGKMSHKIVIIVFALMCCALVHQVLHGIFSILFGPISEVSMSTIGFWLLSRTLLVSALVYFFVKCSSKFKLLFSQKYTTIFLISTNINFIVVMLISFPKPENVYLAYLRQELPVFNFLITILILFYVFTSLGHEYYENSKLLQYNQQLSLYQKHLSETESMHQDIRNMQHELKNNVFYMRLLLKQKDYDQLEDYFKRIYEDAYSIAMIDSGDRFIDAVLNQKMAYAKSKEIPVSFKTDIKTELRIDGSHCCTIISNIIDNAIEASEHVASPEILFEITQKKRFIFIMCKNKVDGDILASNPNLFTTKENSSNHGIGLNIVKKIVDQYDGNIEFTMEDSFFQVNIMLNIHTEKAV